MSCCKLKSQKEPNIQKLKDNTRRDEIKDQLAHIVTNIIQEKVTVNMWNTIKNSNHSKVYSKLKNRKRYTETALDEKKNLRTHGRTKKPQKQK